MIFVIQYILVGTPDLYVCTNCFDTMFSITVQQICMKLGVLLAPNSGCLGLILQLWSSSTFGV